MITIPFTSQPAQRFRSFRRVAAAWTFLTQVLAPLFRLLKSSPRRGRQPQPTPPAQRIGYRSYGAWLDAYHAQRESVEKSAFMDHPDDALARFDQIKVEMGTWAVAHGGSDTARWSETERAVHDVTSAPATWAR